MVERIDKITSLKFGQLMAVYEEGNIENGRMNYPNYSESEQVLAAEQDFYQFLKDFFLNSGCYYYVLSDKGYYVSALRIEPYKDGYLLEALETKPKLRGKGYAQTLVLEMLKSLSTENETTVYSHISKTNAISIAVHEKCAFEKILDYAAYIDGSVNNRAYTYCYRINKTPAE